MPRNDPALQVDADDENIDYGDTKDGCQAASASALTSARVNHPPPSTHCVSILLMSSLKKTGPQLTVTSKRF